MKHDGALKIMNDKITRKNFAKALKDLDMGRGSLKSVLDGSNVRMLNFVKVANYVGIDFDYEDFIEQLRKYQIRKDISIASIEMRSGICDKSIKNVLNLRPVSLYTFLDVADAIGLDWGN